MTLAESRVRRAWVGFSALAFAICGVLLLVQFSGKVAPANQPARSPAPETAPAPPPPASPQNKTAPEPPTRPSVAPQKARPPTPGGEPSLADEPVASTGTLSGLSPHTKKKLPAPRGPAKRPSGGGDAPPDPISLGATGTMGHGTKGNGAGPGRLGTPAPRSPAPSKDPGQHAALDQRDDGAGGEGHGAPPAAADAPGSPVIGGARPSAAGPSELSEGVLKVNVPPSMIVGQSDHVRAVVGKKIHNALVDQEAALETNDGARVQIGRDLMISTLVRMDLRGDSAGDFEITLFSPDATQHISDNDATVWEWAVTPKQEGMHGLTLIVSDLKEGSRELMRSKIYPVHIDVRVTAWQRVREMTVAGSTMLSGLAGLIGAWLGLLRPLLQRRTPGGEGGGSGGGGGSASRGPGTGSSAAPVATHGAAAPHAVAHLAHTAQAAAPVATAPPAAVPMSSLAAGSSADAMSIDVAMAAAPPVAAVMPAVGTGPVSGPVSGPVPTKPAAS